MFKFQHRHLEERKLIKEEKEQKENERAKRLFPNGVKYGGRIFEVLIYIDKGNNLISELLIKNKYASYWVIEMFCIKI